MDFKDKPYALPVIGAVLALIVLVSVWFMSGRAKAIPTVAEGPTLTPEQETMRQAQGESSLGANGGAAGRDVGDTGGK